MVIILFFEVYKFFFWYFFLYLIGNISLEFTDINFIIFLRFDFCLFFVSNDFEKIKFIFCRLYVCVYESNLYKVLELFCDIKLYEYIRLC